MAISRVLSPAMIGREAELSTLEDGLLSHPRLAAHDDDTAIETPGWATLPSRPTSARLQGAAEGGEVLLADEVYRRSRDWLETQRIAVLPVQLDLKGFSGPVKAYKVRSEVAVAAPA